MNWKEDEWLRFVEREGNPKTKVYSVISKCSDCELGVINWYPGWRHYCFFPTIAVQTVHSDRCLLSISEFMTALNEEHKRKRVVVKKKKGFTVVIPDYIRKQIEAAPDEVKVEIEKLTKGFVDGTIDPAKAGTRVHPKPLKRKLKCRECLSKDISWFRDGDEVYYRCASCGEHAWMYYKEYLHACRKHPEMVFK